MEAAEGDQQRASLIAQVYIPGQRAARAGVAPPDPPRRGGAPVERGDGKREQGTLIQGGVEQRHLEAGVEQPRVERVALQRRHRCG